MRFAWLAIDSAAASATTPTMNAAPRVRNGCVRSSSQLCFGATARLSTNKRAAPTMAPTIDTNGPLAVRAISRVENRRDNPCERNRTAA